jgi:AAA+ superfamily predicted ATPase
MNQRADPLSDLELLIRSRYGLIHVETEEEERVLVLLRHLSDRMTLPLFTWSRTRGLRRDGYENAIYDTTEPGAALGHVFAAKLAAIYYFASLGTLLQNEIVAEQVKEVVAELGSRSGALMVSGTGWQAPAGLQRLLATVSLPAPEAGEYRRLLQGIVRDLEQRSSVHVELLPEDEQRLFASLRGLTLVEAEKILTRAIVEDGRLTSDDVRHIAEAKREIVEREGVLEYYPLEETLQQVADLAGLKAWLAKRRNIITAPERAASFGLTFPKGVLLIGVPGCGKSLCARAVAMEWGLPLLKLDTGALYNKYIGETEKNFRRAMQVAERVAPCVLFIDELEKAFAQGDTEDGGVSQRVLGTFLSWLQDRKADVFTVATANDVSRLPAEFLRKGRFDEIFFVDLPGPEARRAILEIHLAKRNQDPAGFDLDLLTAATEDFSGAEIEQVIVAALYTAFAEGNPLTTDQLLRETAATRPLAVVMHERIAALRAWARTRTVPAN